MHFDGKRCAKWWRADMSDNAVRRLGGMAAREIFRKWAVVGAGEIEQRNGEIRCSGHN